MTTTTTSTTHGDLMDYATARRIRSATAEEARQSREAAESDGGAGVILVDGRACYVEE